MLIIHYTSMLVTSRIPQILQRFFILSICSFHPAFILHSHAMNLYPFQNPNFCLKGIEKEFKLRYTNNGLIDFLYGSAKEKKWKRIRTNR